MFVVIPFRFLTKVFAVSILDVYNGHFGKGCEISPQDDSYGDISKLSDVRVTNDVVYLALTLKRLLNISSNITRTNYNRPCKNIWHPCKPKYCSRNLSNDLTERIWDIRSPRFLLSPEQWNIIHRLSLSIPSNEILVLSAASSNHFNEAQAMFQNVHSALQQQIHNMTFVFLDLGLTHHQRNLAQKVCRCHVISFPFHFFPSGFKTLFFFHWKPIFILAAMMKTKNLVVYQDSSIAWKETARELIERADKLSLQLFVPRLFHNIPTATLKGMFDYMGEQPCSFLPFSQIPANFAIFKRTNFNMKAILEPWAKCAFERDCLVPNATVKDRNCSKNHTGLHSCHRFDQSAYSIILTKLFGTDMYKYYIPDTIRESMGKYILVDRARKNETYFELLLNMSNKK